MDDGKHLSRLIRVEHRTKALGVYFTQESFSIIEPYFSTLEIQVSHLSAGSGKYPMILAPRDKNTRDFLRAKSFCNPKSQDLMANGNTIAINFNDFSAHQSPEDFNEYGGSLH